MNIALLFCPTNDFRQPTPTELAAYPGKASAITDYGASAKFSK
jgi:hypothetical protein